MLLAAAGAKWNVNPADLRIDKWRHPPCGLRASRGTLGQFAQAAAALPLPPVARLKPRGERRCSDASPARLDVPERLIRPRAQFGIDVRPDGLLYAAIKHPAGYRRRTTGAALEGAARRRGNAASGAWPNWLAVIATSYWSAQQALADVELVGGGRGIGLVQRAVGGAAMAARRQDSGPRAGQTDSPHLWRGTATRRPSPPQQRQRFDADYSVPFLAHADGTAELCRCASLVTAKRTQG